MSLWDRLKARVGLAGAERGEPAPEASDEVERAAREEDAALRGGAFAVGEEKKDEELAALAKVGTGEGPSVEEAIALLRRVRGTTRETTALAFALQAADAPVPVLVASAVMLAARGEVPRALELLARASTPEALLLTADLAASVGELPRAIGAIERVLARQIDTPGARERHARWVEALGGGRKPTRHLDEATVVTSRTTQGPYRLLREVARGGAGTVYEAEDELLGRRIAFKVYHGEGADRAAVEREIRLFAKLTGRGVARVFDADPSQGWMALEWIPRGSLRDLLRVGRTEDLVPLERWARPLAVALARVHREGLVHGDVKPANVLLREADDPVLTDFGITRPAGEAQAGGSAGYLSPERLARAPASPLDDVYGFGRIVEDVLERCVDPRAAYWREVVVACVGPASHRPMDGAQLSALLGADAGLPRSSAA